MNRRALPSLWIAVTVLFAGLVSTNFAAPREPARLSQAAAQQSPQFQALPLERSRQNHLLIRAFINGKPALLGVDTGAPVSAVAAARRVHFGLSSIPESSELPAKLRINGGFDRVAIAHHLGLGALTLIDEPMVAVDLSGPARAARDFHEEQLDGILGADILFPTQAVVDCDAQLLIMKLDPDAHGTVPGFRSFAELVDRQPTTAPEDRRTGASMHYTSGTTGRPKGVRRPLSQMDPDTTGGAILLGLRGVAVVGHGSSGPEGIANAVRLAARTVDERAVERTTKLLERSRMTRGELRRESLAAGMRDRKEP